jgi:alanyl-tRNA synthetase
MPIHSLGLREAFMYKLLPALGRFNGQCLSGTHAQNDLISKVMKEEEESFLRTLETGIALLDKIMVETKKSQKTMVSGKAAFELYDTFGFPLDLTELILKEQHMIVNKPEFESEMEAQKERARNATSIQTDDWVVTTTLTWKLTLVKYRKITSKGQELFQLVFNVTPFYGESGGQMGDIGWIENQTEKIDIIDTKKENNLIVHLTKQLPTNPSAKFNAVVNNDKRQQTAGNHTATHLLHQALRHILGTHVEQKGSLVHPEYLRFDFSHFQKLSNEELVDVEKMVNRLIRKNLSLHENREVPVSKAQEMGAMALFGEKYGDVVRTIQFGDSLELCGGTHAKATGEIGIFKIISESSISAGVRRIEAVTGEKAEEFFQHQTTMLKEIQAMLKNPANLQKSMQSMFEDNASMAKELDQMRQSMMGIEKHNMNDKAVEVDGIRIVTGMVKPILQDVLKDFSYQLRGDQPNFVAILGANVKGNPQIAVIISENLIAEKGLNAIEIIKHVSKEIHLHLVQPRWIQGGGGGQPFFASAGGKNLNGLDKALAMAYDFVKAKLK